MNGMALKTSQMLPRGVARYLSGAPQQGMGNRFFGMRTAGVSSALSRGFSSAPTTHEEHERAARPARILVTGCLGQIGSELMTELRDRGHVVIGSDIKKPDPSIEPTLGTFLYADVTDQQQLSKIIVENRIEWLIHNAALLSGAGERNPQLALHLNIGGLHNALELSRIHGLRLFCPSSIAAFGPTTPLENTPDLTIQRPTTVYGVSKVYAEHLGEYYHHRYGVDFRSLRYPGVISSKTLPGGGTTDYAVEMYYYAIEKLKFRANEQHAPFHCFIQKDERLPMMYMPDCIRATVTLLEADPKSLKQRTYNVSAMSFTPAEEAEAIKKYFPNFEIEYQPDFRQAIAASWPKRLDDTRAREDWGWKEDYDLDAMTKDMLVSLERRLSRPVRL